MPETTVNDTIDRRQRILAAADELFTRGGYDGVSMRDVALKAGVNKALVFYYFDSKESLFRAVLDSYGRADLASLTAALPDAATIRQRVHLVIDAFLDFTENNIHYTRLIQREMTLSLNRDLVPVQEYTSALLQWVMGFMREFLPDHGPLSAQQFLVSMSSLVMNYYLHTPLITHFLGVDALSPQALDERRRHLHWLIDAVLDALPGIDVDQADATVQ